MTGCDVQHDWLRPPSEQVGDTIAVSTPRGGATVLGEEPTRPKISQESPGGQVRQNEADPISDLIASTMSV